MHIVYNPAFLIADYAHDPAAAEGRLEAILEALERFFNHRVFGCN